MTFPSKFSAITGKKLLLAKWFENSIIVLPNEMGLEIIQKIIHDTSTLLPEVRDLERFFYGSASIVTLGNKNRFGLTSELREYAKIGQKAVFVGVGERIELWDEKIYMDYGKIRELQIRGTALLHYNRIVERKDTKNESV